MSASYGEYEVQETNQQQKPEDVATLVTLLTYCQAIYDSARYLANKVDVIEKKVSRIHHFRAMPLWRYPVMMPFVFAFRQYNYQVAKRRRIQKQTKKKKKKKKTGPGSFSSAESYTPTLPVRMREYDNEEDIRPPSFHSQDSQETIRMMSPEGVLRDTPPPHTFQSSPPQSYYRSDDNMAGPSTGSYQLPSMGTHFPAGPSSTTVVHDQRNDKGPLPDCEMRNYDVPENQRAGLSVQVPTNLERQDNAVDVAGWSVDDVILFVNHIDPPLACSICSVIREHEIDGKALLLLNQDTMINFMGLKLGVAMKLSYLTEQLREGKIPVL